MKSKNTVTLRARAFFWDGSKQLPGLLKLNKEKLLFQFDDFLHSHLKLCIDLKSIDSVKVFLVFNIAKNGLKITSNNQKIDMFILDEAELFYECLKKQMNEIT